MIGAKAAKQAMAALAITVGLLAFGSSARAEDWSFSGNDMWGNYRLGDYFENLGNFNWHEVIAGNTVNRFREVQRTNTYVILLNAPARVRVCIFYNSNMQPLIEYPGSGGWRYLAPGTYRP